LKFSKTSLKDVLLIDLDLNEDERGWFSRVYCENEFQNVGVKNEIKQINSSASLKKGTLRGIHFQNSPFRESKIFKVLRGSICSLIVDLRIDSPTYLKYDSFELDSSKRNMIFVPEGFGNSTLSLTNHVEILYFVNQFYTPSVENGIRWDDPFFNFEWPIKPVHISEKDRNWPDFRP
jgi:dTDP-4-dehydrorhamnose 3,5-epimerase